MPLVKQYATYEDVEAAPDTMVAELIDGDLYLSPRPASRHARATTKLGTQLDPEFDGPVRGNRGGWWLLFEPELHFGKNVLVPAIAGWRRERMPQMPDVAAFTLAPDWLCETLSPSTARLDRERKLAVYAREGVGHCWLLDPVARRLEVYRLEDGRWTLASTHMGDAPIEAEPFASLPLQPSTWWLPASPAA
jgi:Uma2 family endonuclease